MTGSWEQFDFNGRPASAWVPDRLQQRAFTFDTATIRLAEQASAAISKSDEMRPTNWEPLARLLLRTEGIASSSIEGVRAPLVDIAFAELDHGLGDAAWIADNLTATTSALAATEPLSHDLLHHWHRQLMGHSTLTPEMIGAYRAAPSWIGGTSPLDAAFVPPPSELIPELMASLIDFANEEHFDPVTQASLVHAQFETIHPYGDGNGRLGRILIGWVLRRRGVLTKLPPPISVLISRDPGGYISGLHLFREGPVDAYVRWFARVADSAATQSSTMTKVVEQQLAHWDSMLTDLRADAAARHIISLLPEVPVLTASIASARLGVSERAARSALAVLTDRKILTAVEPSTRTAKRGRNPDFFAATALLEATESWAR